MAETEKGASSSVNQKKKDSLLDLDLGNDFLGSWKSMSMTEDPMDLDFVSVSKGMKKAFNFDKVMETVVYFCLPYTLMFNGILDR